jgi:hypothetical protein
MLLFLSTLNIAFCINSINIVNKYFRLELLAYLFQVRNIIISNIPAMATVHHPIILDIFPLIQGPSIFLSLAILIIVTRTGMATIAFITFAFN